MTLQITGSSMSNTTISVPHHGAEPGQQMRLVRLQGRAGTAEAFAGSAWALAQRIAAALALLMLLPFFAVLYPLVRLTSRGPFLYAQMRPGRNGIPFRAWKVRTMHVGADRDAKAARGVRGADPRVTRLGGILRDLKIDELPQFYNVMRGEMALVGPRPLAISFQQELEQKIPGFSARLLVLPGITSLPQVCVYESEDQDRVVADWTRRFAMERHYIANQGVGYDIVIIALTIALILRKAWGSLASRLPGIGSRGASASILLLCLSLAGCASTGGSEFGAAVPAAIPLRETTGVTTSGSVSKQQDAMPLRATVVSAGKPEAEYRVGPGDVLKVNVFGEAGMNDLAIEVQSDGTIPLPAISAQKLSGLTLREAQENLTKAYASQFNEPWVMVTIASYGSRPVYLLGEFNKPGVNYLQRPTNLLNALALGNGTTDRAYLPGARVIRGKSILPVDIKAVLKEGRLDGNIWLRGGDTIFVPSSDDLKVYVAGAVRAPGVFPFGDARQTLVRSLTAAGGLDTAKADMKQVRVIRTRSPVEGEVYQIDVGMILAGKSRDFELQPEDIVYVPQNGLASWNDVVKQLLPTLQLISAPIQPFLFLNSLGEDS
jgi:polysaccharide biosynthesis/export protein